MTLAQRAEIMPHEVHDTVNAYLAGNDQWYFRTDGKGVVFIVSASTPEEVRGASRRLARGPELWHSRRGLAGVPEWYRERSQKPPPKGIAGSSPAPGTFVPVPAPVPVPDSWGCPGFVDTGLVTNPPLKLHRAQEPDSRMPSRRVVEPSDVVDDHSTRRDSRREGHPCGALRL